MTEYLKVLERFLQKIHRDPLEEPLKRMIVFLALVLPLGAYAQYSFAGFDFRGCMPGAVALGAVEPGARGTTVASIEPIGQSKSSGFFFSGMAGYQIDKSWAVELKAGLGGYASSLSTNYQASETYNSGTYSSGDWIGYDIGAVDAEVYARYSLSSVLGDPRGHGLQLLAGGGVIVTITGGGLLYSHVWGWPDYYFGSGAPMAYRSATVLADILYPFFAKAGLEYEIYFGKWSLFAMADGKFFPLKFIATDGLAVTDGNNSRSVGLSNDWLIPSFSAGTRFYM
jgi:hypothetical protein